MIRDVDQLSRGVAAAISRRDVVRRLVAFTLGTGAAVAALPRGTAARRQNRSFNAAGQGTLRQPLPMGCELSPNGCTLQVTGSGRIAGVGPIAVAMRLTGDWLNSTPNGNGGRCAPLTGQATFRSSQGPRPGAIGLQIAGRLCEVGPTAPGVPLTITNGRYRVTGGTSSFRRAKGNGRFYGDATAAAESITFSAVGRIIY